MSINSAHRAPDVDALEHAVAQQSASPLFVRLAERYIDANRPAQALKTCLQGMRYYPEYPTGLLLIAKAQVMLRQYSDARDTLHELLRILPSCQAGIRLLDRMTELELEYPPYTASAGSHFVQVGFDRQPSSNDGEQFSRQDDILPDFEIRRPGAPGPEDGGDSASHTAADAPEKGAAPVPPGGGDTTQSRDAPEMEREHSGPPAFDLAGLASKLENARIPALPEQDDGSSDAEEDEDIESVNLDARPITETLIEIYIQQGRLREAIDALQRLADRNPDRADDITAKIRTLETRLESGED